MIRISRTAVRGPAAKPAPTPERHTTARAASAKPAPTPARRAALHHALLAWYRRNARDLPWRRTRDAWAIWVSEVMLQQTRVETARPFYLRFIERYPTPASFSRAHEDDVLAAWAGLGYYRRARQLHEAARDVVREHGGRVPRDPESFGNLPGVGRYTQAAVLSIGFGTPLAVLDGNVARVLSRLFALKASVREARGARALWALAESLIPARAPGDWNQALMELGAMVCTPRTPRCAACPLQKQCRAFALGRVAAYPPRAPRREMERVRRAVALIERHGRVLMTRRRGPLLDGLWEPPGVELKNGESARAKLAAALRRLGVRAAFEPTGRVVRHVITHRKIEVEVWRGSRAPEPPRGSRYVSATDSGVALTAFARRLMRDLE
ncbi:MAG: A/G-specific adenine glycosylase [Candidatus Eisenbacteria bacterium]|nr:A/G-specific adenine glycosylase [Candidatus Eisenbacteria bacterium]